MSCNLSKVSFSNSVNFSKRELSVSFFSSCPSSDFWFEEGSICLGFLLSSSFKGAVSLSPNNLMSQPHSCNCSGVYILAQRELGLNGKPSGRGISFSVPS